MENSRMAKRWEEIKTEVSDLFANEQQLNELAMRLGKTVEEVRASEDQIRFLFDTFVSQDTAERKHSPNDFKGTRESRSKALKIALWLSKLPSDKGVAEYASIFEETDNLVFMELKKNGIITEIEYDLVALDPKKPFEFPERLFTISNEQSPFECRQKLTELRPGIQAEEYWKEYRIKFDATRAKLFVDECVQNWLDGKTFRPYTKPLAQTDWQIGTLRNALREKREKFGDQFIEVSESEKWTDEIDLTPALAYLDTIGEVSIDASVYGTTVTFAGPTRFPLRISKAVGDGTSEKIRLSETALTDVTLTLGGREIKLGELQATVIGALLEHEAGEWVDFDEMAEYSQDGRRYDDETDYGTEMHRKRNLQYYGAVRRLNEKIYAKVGIKDFLEKTSKAARIRPDKAID